MLPVAILAGGLATRLRPLTTRLPKALIDVNGEPFLAHQLRLLQKNGIARVVICVGHLGEMIQQEIGDGRRFGLSIDYADDGPQLRGTAGAVRRALPLLGEEFFILYGDSYLTCDYQAVGRAFGRAGTLALMTVFRNENRWGASNVEFLDGRILAYDKEEPTPAMQHIDYGLSVARAAAFTTVPEQGAYDLALLYQQLLARGELAGLQIQERFYEVGSPHGLRETEGFLAKQGDAQEWRTA